MTREEIQAGVLLVVLMLVALVIGFLLGVSWARP